MSEHFRLIGSETVVLTKDLAAEFSVMPASITERDLKPKRLAYLKNAVLGGTAISFIWARAKVVETNEVYRVNGHHSSTMLASLDGLFPDGLKVHIDDFEVPAILDLAFLFRQFDNRGSARTIDDISGAYQSLQPALAKIPRVAARAAIEGHNWWQRQIVGMPVLAGDDRFQLFNRVELHPFMQMVGGVCSAKTPEFTSAVLGAMYGTWEREPKVAAQFWPEVAIGAHDSNGSTEPAIVLDAWLLEAYERKGDKPKQTEVYRACAVAWNAYRNHRALAKIGKYDPVKGAPELD